MEEHDILPRWKKRKQSLSAEKLKSVRSGKLEMYIPDLPVNIKIERIKMTDEKQAEKRLSPRIAKANSKFATLPANKTVMKTERSPARVQRERL